MKVPTWAFRTRSSVAMRSEASTRADVAIADGRHDALATEPGAIIMGNEYQALGLLRQLSVDGVSCVLIDQHPLGPALFSRFRWRFHRAPGYSSEEFWPWLVTLATRYGYLGWVLIPTDDEQVRQLAEHYDEAQALFRYAGLPWESYRLIYDKRIAHEWARLLGVDAPRSFIPMRRDELPGPGLPFPVIIKPAIKRTFSRYSKKKAIRVESPSDLRDMLSHHLASVPVEELMYQEIVPGDGRYQWSYAGFFLNGEPVAAFTACRRRQHPPDFGRASTYVVALHDEEVEAKSRRLLAALAYTGLAEVEWKRDPRDGTLKFLEINARSWGWHTLATRVVGDVPKMLFDYLLCGAVNPVEPKYGSRWVKWITDVPVALHLFRRRELSWREYVSGLRGDLVSCDWERSDPAPFLLQAALLPYLIAKRGY